MKEISLKMSDIFKIEVLSYNKIYELENNACKINIECDVDSSLTYKLHVEHKTDKSYIVMTKNADSISADITSAYFTENGSYYLQVEGIKTGYRIISNTIKLEVGGFINAEEIPTPEQQSVINGILIRVNALEDGVEDIESDIATLETSVGAKADKSYVDTKLATKQDKLVAGSGISIASDGKTISATATGDVTKAYVDTELAKKQNTLVSGTNIKTINNQSILGDGDISIAGDVTKSYVDTQDDAIRNSIPTKTSQLTNDSNLVSEGANLSVFTNDSDFTTTEQVATQLDGKQDTLVSGENIKTVNNQSLLGEGNITISGGGSTVSMADNVSGGVDLTVDGTSRTLAKSSELATVNDALSELSSSVVKKVNNTSPDANGNVNVTVSDEQVQAGVQNYLDTHGGVYASQSDMNLLIAKTSYVVADINTVEFEQGYLGSGGVFIPTSGTDKQRTSDYIELSSDVYYALEISGISGESTSTTPRMIAVYNADKTYSRNLSLPSDLSAFKLVNNENYIRINYNWDSITSLVLYPILKGKNTITDLATFNKNAINRLIANTNSGGNYIGARRPIVSFVIDGNYSLTDTFEQIFYNRGYLIGFAPQYTNFTGNKQDLDTIKQYIGYQDKGHTLLSHLTYDMSDNTSLSDEQCKFYIKQSKEYFTNCGISVKGAIGRGGSVAERFLPTIKKYYDYSATKYNHMGSGGEYLESCLFFNSDNPYKLWRYSMQASTLAQMKLAVDRAIDEIGLCWFYGHANPSELGYFTNDNINELLDYIESKGAVISVKTPDDAIKDFYSIRYDDISH